VVADLDADKRPDIIAGDMTAGGWDFPLNPRLKIAAYMNRGGLRFERITLVEGWGVHEMGLTRPRGGRPFILYAADEIQPQKFPEMKTHGILGSFCQSSRVCDTRQRRAEPPRRKFTREFRSRRGLRPRP
jgi:hypothetical protein